MELTNTFRIPLVIRGNSPFAKISINGNELTFLVDSGAGLSVYDKKFINILGLSTDQLGEAITNISGIGENSFDGRLVMIFFNIDNTRFANQFTVSEMGDTFRAFKDSLGDVAGIIGGDFLFSYGAVIDYGQQELRFEKDRINSIMHDIMSRINVSETDECRMMLED
ncbi:MAG: aspartyl protease family protein [Bacteroidaceae bacterium]|nr:aspartyl protease family protein [Bacteroidaceae bacterium]